MNVGTNPALSIQCFARVGGVPKCDKPACEKPLRASDRAFSDRSDLVSPHAVHIIFRVPQLVRVLLHFSVHLVGNDEERSGGPDRHTNSDRGRL